MSINCQRDIKESMSKPYAFYTEDWVKIGPPQVTGSLVCLGAGGQTKGARRINRFSIDLHVSAYAGGKEDFFGCEGECSWQLTWKISKTRQVCVHWEGL